ncbi:MAG: DedA family protein [Herpetosiphonaceae bacterium]|nr:DedA family protein [Herpetosiphonaceae bacterium]
MRGFLERHTDLAIFLILFLEDLGVPMPIPADVVVLYAGFRLSQHKLNPLIAIVLMILAVNLGASTLYSIVRRGGRPLVDRFGRFIHLDAAHLEKAEGWLQRKGMVGIAIGRAIPGVRLATVIACGLFKVPYRRFAPAQFVGTLVYLVVFLLIGYFVGPQAAERIHLPTISLRLILLLVVAIGLPLVLRHLNRSTASDDTRAIQTGLTTTERRAAAALGGFVGMIELTCIWGVTASVTNLLGQTEVNHAALTLARWLAADRLPRGPELAYILDYLLTCIICVAAAVVFFQVIMPLLHLRPRRLGPQTLLLWGGMVLLTLLAVVFGILRQIVRHPAIGTIWLSHSGGIVLGILVVGLLGYAYVTTATRRLAIDQFSDDPIIAPSLVATNNGL